MDNFTPEIQDALFEMFASEGWQYFIEDAQRNLEGVNHLDSIIGEQQLGFRQGQVSTLKGLIGYEDTLRTAAQQYTEDTATVTEQEDVTL